MDVLTTRARPAPRWEAARHARPPLAPAPVPPAPDTSLAEAWAELARTSIGARAAILARLERDAQAELAAALTPEALIEMLLHLPAATRVELVRRLPEELGDAVLDLLAVVQREAAGPPPSSLHGAGPPRLLHAVAGRLRVHLPGWDGTDAERVEAAIRRLAGVRQVEANPLTGNVLVRYDAGATDEQRILGGLRLLTGAAVGGAEGRDEAVRGTGMDALAPHLPRIALLLLSILAVRTPLDAVVAGVESMCFGAELLYGRSG